MISNKRHFVYNLLTSYGNTIASAVISFVSVPIALNYWGGELYGVWTILTSFAAYITASGLGIDGATGALMTKNADIRVKVGILKKGVRLLLCSSFVAAAVTLLLTLFVPDWFKIIGKMNEANYPIAKLSAIIFVFGIIINLPLSAVSNSLQSFGKAYIYNVMTTLQNVLVFLSIVITAALKFSLPVYVLLVQSVTILCSLIKLFIVLATAKKELAALGDAPPPLPEAPDNRYMTILKMGVNGSLYSLALMLVPNISNLIISNNLDVGALVPYSLSFKLFSMITVFVSNVNVSMSPLMGREYGNKNWTWLVDAHKKMFKSTVSLGLFVILGVIWLSKPFIFFWTGSTKNYAGDFISILVGLYFLIMVLSTVNHVVINAFNYTSKVWVISWADGAVFLLSSLLFIKKLGVLAVPLGLCAGGYLVSFWAYPLLVYLRTQKRFKYDFAYLLKNFCAFIISLMLFLIVSNLNVSFAAQTFLQVLGMAATTVVLLLLSPAEFKNVLLKKIGRRSS